MHFLTAKQWAPMGTGSDDGVCVWQVPIAGANCHTCHCKVTVRFEWVLKGSLCDMQTVQCHW